MAACGNAESLVCISGVQSVRGWEGYGANSDGWQNQTQNERDMALLVLKIRSIYVKVRETFDRVSKIAGIDMALSDILPRFV